jgi:hypothetical protein
MCANNGIQHHAIDVGKVGVGIGFAIRLMLGGKPRTLRNSQLLQIVRSNVRHASQ